MKHRHASPFARVLLPMLALSSAAATQKVCASANTTTRPTYRATPVTRAWFAHRISFSQPTVVTAADFKLTTHQRSTVDGQGQIGIWDANGRVPGKLLGRAAISVSARIPGWYGAKFGATGIPIPKAGNYFVAFRSLRGGIIVGLSAGGQNTPYYWGPPVLSPWRGPIRAAWSYRVYCGTHGGSFTSYGAGKPGSGNVAPRLRGLGQPNTTNAIDVQLGRGLGGAAAVFAWGPRATTTLPFGQLHVAPLIAIPTALAGTGSGFGHRTLALSLPDNASWKGARIAVQGWVVDPVAALGLAHTAGLELTIGH